jgi:hypothetical protein
MGSPSVATATPRRDIATSSARKSRRRAGASPRGRHDSRTPLFDDDPTFLPKIGFADLAGDLHKPRAPALHGFYLVRGVDAGRVEGRDVTPALSEDYRSIKLSLFRGGCLYWVQERLWLIRPDHWDLQRRMPFVLAITWIPLLVLTMAHGGWPDLRALLLDYEVYARIFIAIPLLLIGQITVDARFRAMAQQFVDANIVRFTDLARFQRIMMQAVRIRDAKLPELLAILVVLYLQLRRILASGRLQLEPWAADPGGTLTLAGDYSVLVDHSLLLGLIAVAVWKWVIWIYVLIRVSRLDLQLDATDGDRNGGLGFLAYIPLAFVPVVIALATVMGATWRSEILAGRMTLLDLRVPVGALAILVLAILWLPLMVFIPKLAHEKWEGIRRYGALRHMHSLKFRDKWLGHRQTQNVESLLGSPDASSLADISTGTNNVSDMRVFLLDRRTGLTVLIALVAPLIPAVTAQIPLTDAIRKLFTAIR